MSAICECLYDGWGTRLERCALHADKPLPTVTLDDVMPLADRSALSDFQRRMFWFHHGTDGLRALALAAKDGAK